jgi:hypothetical protein
LLADGMSPWLDEKKIVGGQEWDLEIKKAVRDSDVILVCLSSASASRAGYLQKEIKFVLDVAEEQPDGAIFVVPVKLDDCDIPNRLAKWQWVRYSNGGDYEKIASALRERATQCGFKISAPTRRRVEARPSARVAVLSLEIHAGSGYERRVYDVHVDGKSYMKSASTAGRIVSLHQPLPLGRHSVRVHYDLYVPRGFPTGRGPADPAYIAKGKTETKTENFKAGIYTISLVSIAKHGLFDAFLSRDRVDDFRLELDFRPFVE